MNVSTCPNAVIVSALKCRVIIIDAYHPHKPNMSNYSRYYYYRCLFRPLNAAEFYTTDPVVRGGKNRTSIYNLFVNPILNDIIMMYVQRYTID